MEKHVGEKSIVGGPNYCLLQKRQCVAQWDNFYASNTNLLLNIHIYKRSCHNYNNHMQIIPNNWAFYVAPILIFFKRANINRSDCYVSQTGQAGIARLTKCCLLGRHILDCKDLGSPPVPITPTKLIFTKNWGFSLPFHVVKGSLKTVIVSVTADDGSIFKQQIKVEWIIQGRKNFIYKITFSL